MLDSLHVTIQSETDTLINKNLRFSLHYKGTKPRNERDARILKVFDNLNKNLLAPGEDLLLRFQEPVIDIRFHDTSIFVVGADTAYNSMHFEQMDAYGLEYRLVATIYDSTNYTINIPDSVFYSVRGRTQEAFSLKFKRAVEADFGNIIIKVFPPDDRQAVVQLLNSKGAVQDQQVVDSTTTVAFRQLLPGKYKLQAVIDDDRNGKWSTGNFHRRFQPETIVPYKDDLDLKSGWDIAPDEIWKF